MSNREIIDRALGALARELNGYLTSRLGSDWIEELKKRDENKGISGRSYRPDDVSQSLRMFTDRLDRSVATQIDTDNRKRGLASEIREVRNRWAHREEFSDEDAYRSIDSMQRLIVSIGGHCQLEGAAELKIRMAGAILKSGDEKDLRARATEPEVVDTEAVEVELANAGNGSSSTTRTSSIDYDFPQANSFRAINEPLRDPGTHLGPYLLSAPRKGDLVEGRSIGGGNDHEILVRLSTDELGVVPIHELSLNPDAPRHLINMGPGDEELLVLEMEDERGRMILSKMHARYLRAPSLIEKSGGKGGILEGLVIEVVDNGLILDVGFPGYIPREFSGNDSASVWNDRSSALRHWMGLKLRAQIVEIDYTSPRLLLSRTAWIDAQKPSHLSGIIKAGNHGEWDGEHLTRVHEEAEKARVSVMVYLEILKDSGFFVKSGSSRVNISVAREISLDLS